MTASPIESLLDHVDDADKRPAPTIEEFLEEEGTSQHYRIPLRARAFLSLASRVADIGAFSRRRTLASAQMASRWREGNRASIRCSELATCGILTDHLLSTHRSILLA